MEVANPRCILGALEMTCIEITVEAHLLAESYVPLHSSGFQCAQMDTTPNYLRTSPDEIHLFE